jgi:hypothetical protein
VEEGGEPPKMIKDLSTEEEGMFLIGGPSWVRTPPELGSKKMYIQKQGWVDMRCLICSRARPVYVMKLDEGICVSCCMNCKQYAWFREESCTTTSPADQTAPETSKDSTE